jgi:hypothetical protein
MSTRSTDRLFADYRQCCLEHLAQHGPATRRRCRCGRPRPCREETQWELMLEMVIGSAA